MRRTRRSAPTHCSDSMRRCLHDSSTGGRGLSDDRGPRRPSRQRSDRRPGRRRPPPIGRPPGSAHPRPGRPMRCVPIGTTRRRTLALQTARPRRRRNEPSAIKWPVEPAGARDAVLADPEVELTLPFARDLVPVRRRPGLGETTLNLTDHLGGDVYVGMLATLIARGTTAMPLSIGLFGRCGSGSYFHVAAPPAAPSAISCRAGHRHPLRRRHHLNLLQRVDSDLRPRHQDDTWQNAAAALSANEGREW